MSKEEAIKEIEKWLDGCPFEDTKEAFILAIKALEERPHGKWSYMPPSNYVRRFGKWLFLNGGCYKCSNCENTALHKYSFCPDCGAQMDKGGEAE